MNAPGITRRHGLMVVAASLTACAWPGAAPDRILDLATGQALTRDDLLRQLRAADFVLLGERHDNPHHHQRRGRLLVDLADLGAAPVVLAEHLGAGARVAPTGDVEQALAAAGFDRRAWQWPVHRGLFGPVRERGLPLLGANAEPALVRRVAREGESALPAPWRDRLAAAPLPAAAQALLDRDLVDGHCGHLGAARLPAMRLAQRLRDATMAQSLLDAGGRPAVLVAGNGHVRVDHGVPQLLRAWRPGARLVAVGFGEHGDEPVSPGPGAPYTHLWITPGLTRADPCAGFRMPAPASAPASR